MVLELFGLLSGFAGAALLYFNGFPTSIDLGEIGGKSKIEYAPEYKLGFLLLTLSFALQLLSLLSQRAT